MTTQEQRYRQIYRSLFMMRYYMRVMVDNCRWFTSETDSFRRQISEMKDLIDGRAAIFGKSSEEDETLSDFMSDMQVSDIDLDGYDPANDFEKCVDLISEQMAKFVAFTKLDPNVEVDPAQLDIFRKG